MTFTFCLCNCRYALRVKLKRRGTGHHRRWVNVVFLCYTVDISILELECESRS